MKPAPLPLRLRLRHAADTASMLGIGILVLLCALCLIVGIPAALWISVHPLVGIGAALAEAIVGAVLWAASE